MIKTQTQVMTVQEYTAQRMALEKGSQYSLTVGHGFIIRQIWLRLLALSMLAACTHSLIAYTLDASHMSDIKFGYRGTTASKTEEEEWREIIALFLNCALPSVHICHHLMNYIHDETVLCPQRDRTFSDWSGKKVTSG